MKQIRKIWVAVLSTILLLCGLYFDISKVIGTNYFNTEIFKINNWTSLSISSKPEKININESIANPVFNIYIKFNYKKNGELYPNLFQTSNYNQGVRLEFSGDRAAIIYNCQHSCPSNGYNVVDISKYLNFSSDNAINLTISQGKFINYSINSNPEVQIRNPPPIIKFDNVLVGSGFDEFREFTGTITEFNLKVISGDKILLYQRAYYFLLVFLYFGLIFYLKKIPTK